ncbi:MAG: H4MPT-linked C1 transfer pathway protein [Chloroflexi bacterium]|nr:H4MPT-linked C1 transfer pathway protein [Chloroflexota bacterium]
MGVVIGWDVGGVNTKAAALSIADGRVVGQELRSRYFEIWHDRRALVAVLRSIAAELPAADVWVATMTAELSDAFQTKREGVGFVVGALAEAAGASRLAIFAVDEAFLAPEQARAEPLRVAAANWAATARLIAREHPNAILVDVGSTTADVIPIVEGRVAAQGLTDPERLLTGELVYTGAVRTPVGAVVQSAPLWGGWCRVSSEHFAIAADVHLLLGNLQPEDYLCDTPDRRGKTPAEAAARLARVVCADVEMLSPAEIHAIAAYVADRQIDQIAAAIRQVMSRRVGREGPNPPAPFPPREGGVIGGVAAGNHKPQTINHKPRPAIAAGLGAFLARAAAERVGLPVVDLAATLGAEGSAVAPSVAVARLWAAAEGWL